MANNTLLIDCVEVINKARKMLHDNRNEVLNGNRVYQGKIRTTLAQVLAKGSRTGYLTEFDINYINSCYDRNQKTINSNSSLNPNERERIVSLFRDLAEVARQYCVIDPQTQSKRKDGGISTSLGLMNSITSSFNQEGYIARKHLNLAQNLAELIEKRTKVSTESMRNEITEYLQRFN